MTVRRLGSLVASELHRAELKALGFAKNGSVFSREREGFTEFYELQGSSWNSGGEPWRFYLNVAVRVHGVVTNANAKGLWRLAHAVGRSNGIVSGSPEHFDVTEGSVAEVGKTLARMIERASRRLPGLVDEIRQRAEAGLASPLPLPES